MIPVNEGESPACPTQVYQWRSRHKRYDFTWLEKRLQRLGFRLVFCTRAPASFAAARAERLEISGKPSQYDNLQEFIDEQEVMRGFIAQSSLMSLNFDVSNNDVAGAVERIADWLEQTGGLTA